MKHSYLLKALSLVTLSLFGSTTVHALVTDKVSVKNDMEVAYLKETETVNNIEEMFEQGLLYGRLRSNYLDYTWKNEHQDHTADNSAWAVGGSLTYSTAYLNGFGATAGFYTSHTINTDNTEYKTDGTTYDAGKVPRNVYDKESGSGDPIDVIAVAYLEYKFAKTNIKAGRQIFDSTIIHSNDVFMIPNAMEGVSIESKEVDDTRLRLAYFNRQKLMGHSDFHSIIAVNGAKENDDGGRHQGLTTTNLELYGREKNPGMIVFSGENKSITGLKLNLDTVYIDDFFAHIIPEVNYKIPLDDTWTVSAGVRYFYQKDKGAGDVGGSSVSGKFAIDKNPTIEQILSYDTIDNLDASAWMSRIVLSNGPGTLSFGYSDIADKGDLVAPWRGFPTAGYTRDLTEYNWFANTKSYMVKATYDLDKANLVEGLFIQLDYANMDYDEVKINAGTISKTDRWIIHFDAIQAVKAIPGLELRARLSWIDADSNPNAYEDYNSYTDFRFEVDYFF